MKELRMRASILGSVAVVAGLAAFGGVADAAIQDFVVRNNTSNDVHYIYVSPVTSNDWEEDVLGADHILPAYTEVAIGMNGYGDQCYFDIKIVDASGYTQEYYGVDLCSVTYVDFQ
jgi:hypothetical protein